MTQRKTISICKEAALHFERSRLAIAVNQRQSKHKAVAGLQARIAEITNELLRLDIRHA